MSECTCTKEIANIAAVVKVHEGRIAKLEQAMAAKDEKYTQIAIDIGDTKKTVENIEKSMEEIKIAIDKSDEKWEKLKEQRNKDHLEEPKKRFEGLVDKLVYLVVGGFLTFILSQAFPFFK